MVDGDEWKHQEGYNESVRIALDEFSSIFQAFYGNVLRETAKRNQGIDRSALEMTLSE